MCWRWGGGGVSWSDPSAPRARQMKVAVDRSLKALPLPGTEMMMWEDKMDKPVEQAKAPGSDVQSRPPQSHH